MLFRSKETKKTFLLVPSGSKELRLAGFGKAVLRVMQNVKCYIFFFLGSWLTLLRLMRELFKSL